MGGRRARATGACRSRQERIGPIAAAVWRRGAGDLEADHVGKAHRTDLEQSWTRPRVEVTADEREAANEPGHQAAEREVLAERHEVALGVALPRPRRRRPDDRRVGDVRWARAVE